MKKNDPLTIEIESASKSRGFFARMRRHFIAGVLVTAPLAITLFLSWKIISYIDTRASHLIPAKYHPESYLPFNIPGTGLVIMTVIFILIGAFAAGFMGRVLVSFSERILDRVPIVRSVYSAIKQIAQSVLAQDSKAFTEVVLLEYPMKDKWAMGFISGRTEGEVQHKTKGGVVSVFVPTTPNPTSGFLLFIPEKDLIPLDMTVEEGIKMVVSSGIVVPPYKTLPVKGKPASKKKSTTAKAKKKPVKKKK